MNANMSMEREHTQRYGNSTGNQAQRHLVSNGSTGYATLCELKIPTHGPCPLHGRTRWLGGRVTTTTSGEDYQNQDQDAFHNILLRIEMWDFLSSINSQRAAQSLLSFDKIIAASTPTTATTPMPRYRPKCEPFIRNSRTSSKLNWLCCPELLSVKAKPCSETLLGVPVNFFLPSRLVFKTTVSCLFFSTALSATFRISGKVCCDSSPTEALEDAAKSDRISITETVLKSMDAPYVLRNFRIELRCKVAWL